MLRAPHSPGSGPRARPRGSPAAHPRPRCAPGQATRLASDSKQCLAQCAQGRSRSRTGSGIRGALAPPQFGLALFGREGAAGGAQIAQTPAEARRRAAGKGLSPRKSGVASGFSKRKQGSGSHPLLPVPDDLHLIFDFLLFWFSDWAGRGRGTDLWILETGGK